MTPFRPWNKGTKRAAQLWLLLCAITLCILTALFHKGLVLESSVISLLPEEEQGTALGQVMEHFVEYAGAHLVIGVGDPDEERALAAGQALRSVLSVSTHFDTSQTKTSDIQDSLISLFAPYKHQLPSASWQEITAGKSDLPALLRSNEKKLYLPTAAWHTRFIARDPLLMLPDFLQRYLAITKNLRVRDGQALFQSEGKTFVVLPVALRGNPFDAEFQRLALADLHYAEEKTREAFPGVEIPWSGILRFAADGAERMQGEVSRIGLCSLAIVTLLLFLCFRSLSYLAHMFLPLVIGVLFAFTYTHLIFGNLHWITLGFGASLIGISVDYTYHYFCDLSAHTTEEQTGVLSRIAPGLTLGALSSILGFAGLATAPLPGLRQMAVFGCIGLSAAYLSVLCIFPRVVKRSSFFADSSLLIQAEKLISRMQSPGSANPVRLVLLASLVTIALGFSSIQSNDDIRLLQEAPAHLVKIDSFLRRNLGQSDIASFIMVEGRSLQDVLERQETLAPILEKQRNTGNISGFEQLSTFLPSKKLQKDIRESVRNALSQHEKEVLQYLERLGLDEGHFADIKGDASSDGLLSYQEWRSSKIGDMLKHLEILKTDKGYVACVFLKEIKDESALVNATSQLAGIQFINRADHISEALQRYRAQSVRAISISYCLAFLLLCFRYGPRFGPCIIVTPLVAALSTISILALLQVPLTLFHVVATMLVLGVGIDYAIFLHENRETQGATFIAVVLSALTTMASFGLLALSSSGVLQYIGKTVLLGILLCVALSPVVLLIPSTTADREPRSGEK